MRLQRYVIAILVVASTFAVRPIGAQPLSRMWIVGVASWASSNGFFYIHRAPHLSAVTTGTLTVGMRLGVMGTVHGDAVDGIDLWYHVRRGIDEGYVLSTAVGYLEPRAPWTAVASGNGEAGVDAIVARTSPHASAPIDGTFAAGQRMTVLGETSGDVTEAGNDRWYRVLTGSSRPVYVYSAYLKYSHAGVGPVPQPRLTAASVLALDLDSGTVLFRQHENDRRAPASLVKLMTAAVALDRRGLDAIMTVPSGAPSVGVEGGGTAMGLDPGERLAVRDLMYGLLLPSGNDAAYTIAQDVGGSQSGFAGLMNAKAQAIGLHHTHFVQAYGFDEPDEYTTASDIAMLARYDVRTYAYIRQVVGTRHHAIGRGVEHPAFSLDNTNKLLGVYPGAFGVKTGTTPAAGQNLVAAAVRGDRHLLVVVLGATDRYMDASSLLNYAAGIERDKRQ